jgi:RNA-directed DNA polymerase
MLPTLASDAVINQAYQWLCHQRRHWHANTDVWELRSHWQRIKPAIQTELLNGTYRFDPMARVSKANGEVIHIWSARDALVLKALTLVLTPHLPIARSCTHVKGNGGAKAAVRAVQAQLPDYAFVMRTDVKGYYEHIDHHQMLTLLARHITDRPILNLLCQAMRRTVTWGGLYWDIDTGISRGCPLSPLLGGFFLHELDAAMDAPGLYYVRFMDDILVLAPTRWKLKDAVRRVNQQLERLALSKHPDKTFIGRIEKGFDFLGYRFSRAGLSVAPATVDRFIAKAARLYEQERCNPAGVPLLGPYVRRWLGWAGGGFGKAQKTPHGAGLLESYYLN